MGVLETPRIKRKTMKVIVRYWTEFGGSESTMNVEEIANFAKKFTIMSVTPIEEEKKYTEEDFKLFARQYYREIKMDKSNLLWEDLADKCLEQFKNK